MKVYVVLDNIMGSKPRCFSSLEKAKEFCKKETESYLVFALEAEEINNSKTIDEKIEDLFIIKEVIIDNNISYEWEKILE